jgi:hypothetical protein
MRTPLLLRLFGLNVLRNQLGPETHVSPSVPISVHCADKEKLLFNLCLGLDRFCDFAARPEVFILNWI